MYHTIKTFSDIGINTIADDVILKSGVWFKEDNRLRICVELLRDYPILFVHVTCPVEELRRREKERGDRDIGLGESLLLELNPQDMYDITVDTYNRTKEECADKIIELLNYPEKFTAFKTLWSQC
jgi:chloramphenicol 3-O phosphotransferase